MKINSVDAVLFQQELLTIHGGVAVSNKLKYVADKLQSYGAWGVSGFACVAVFVVGTVSLGRKYDYLKSKEQIIKELREFDRYENTYGKLNHLSINTLRSELQSKKRQNSKYDLRTGKV